MFVLHAVRGAKEPGDCRKQRDDHQETQDEEPRHAQQVRQSHELKKKKKLEHQQLSNAGHTEEVAD